MIDRRIKFRHIQCFVEICQERSLKRAADKLFLTQPAISKTLKELEDIVQAVLLIRNRAGVSLTKEGDVFLQYARMSLASLQQGLDGLEREASRERQVLTVGALPSVAARYMPQVAIEFGKLAPNAVLRIIDGPHAYLVDRLRLGELDQVIGRLGSPDKMQGISFTQLYSEEVAIVVRAGHPIFEKPDLSRIADWPVIYPPEGAAIRPLVDRFMIANGIGALSNRLETVSGAFGRVYTRNSDAIWLISSGVVANEIADGLLVQLDVDTAITQGPVGLMTRPDHITRPVQRVFSIALQNVLGADLKEGTIA